MTVNGLKEETKAQGKVHESIAKDLEEKIAAPFEEWAEGYKVCFDLVSSETLRNETFVCRNVFCQARPILSMVTSMHMKLPMARYGVCVTLDSPTKFMYAGRSSKRGIFGQNTQSR